MAAAEKIRATTPAEFRVVWDDIPGVQKVRTSHLRMSTRDRQHTHTHTHIHTHTHTPPPPPGGAAAEEVKQGGRLLRQRPPRHTAPLELHQVLDSLGLHSK
jgi:hypothetical protein